MQHSHNDHRAPGAIRRRPGERWADFSARQKAAQDEARRLAIVEAERRRSRSRHRRDATEAFEGSDFDYSLNG